MDWRIDDTGSVIKTPIDRPEPNKPTTEPAESTEDTTPKSAPLGTSFLTGR